MKKIFNSVILAIMLTVSACGESMDTSTPPAVRSMVANNDWAGAVGYYRQALEKDPTNASLRAQYYTVAENAVKYYLDTARRSREKGNITNAEALISRGLLIVPNSQVLRQEMDELRGIKQSVAVYQNALVSHKLGRTSKAMEQLEEALSLDPNNSKAVSLFNELMQQAYNETTIKPIRLKTGALVAVNFRKASFKDAFLALGSAYGVNIVFDADVNDKPISIIAKNVSFEQAFNLMLKANRSFYRRLGQNTVLIIPDNKEKRAEYEDYLVRTFFLKSAKADAISQILATTLGLQNVSVNAKANSITIRDTAERLGLADRLISNNDSRPPEVVLEVEILEVNRTKSEQLGIDFGSQILVTPPSTTVGNLFSGGAGDLINTSVVALPAATLRYFKQDVDAVTLASPRIRTIHEKKALIHIGDRVPLRSSTVQDATGQTRTTFEYRDIGIKLQVTPVISLNNSVTVELHLEVSSLGQNLGTTAEPAFSIGTRNLDTEMTLQDGETAIIGGLIRDEQRETTQKVPGLGNIPLVGRLFRMRDSQDARTDILLTLTPRVVRGWDLPSSAESQFFSGTGQQVTGVRAFDFMATSAPGGDAPTIQLDMSGDGNKALNMLIRRDVEATLPIGTTSTSARNASLSFGETAYETSAGKSATVRLQASGITVDGKANLIVRFNKDIVEATSFKALDASGLNARIDNAAGEIIIDATSLKVGAQTEVAEIVFTARKPGLSYLIYAKTPNGGQNNALPSNIKLGASRIVVR